MTPPDLGAILFSGAFGLVVIGILGIVMSTHLVRIVLSIVLLETGANLLLMLSGYRAGAAAPIIIDGVIPAAMVDPVPQALVLTAIVIGVAVQAFMMTLNQRAFSFGSDFNHPGTTDNLNAKVLASYSLYNGGRDNE